VVCFLWYFEFRSGIRRLKYIGKEKNFKKRVGAAAPPSRTAGHRAAASDHHYLRPPFSPEKRGERTENLREKGKRGERKKKKNEEREGLQLLYTLSRPDPKLMGRTGPNPFENRPTRASFFFSSFYFLYPP